MGNELQTFSADYWKKEAQEAAKFLPQSTMPTLSVRGGILMYEGEPVPGNQVMGVIIDSYRLNTLFVDKYDPDNPASPRCYAFGRDGEQMGPHPSMQADLTYFAPQNATCVGCRFNEFKSAANGKGKACQNRRRLFVIAAGRMSSMTEWTMFDDPKYYAAAAVAQMTLPVTSVQEYNDYVTKCLLLTFGRPPHAVATRISVAPHPKFQFQILFDYYASLPDSIAAPIIARREFQLAAPIPGYSAPKKEDPNIPF